MDESTKNVRPKASTSLPAIVLVVLVGLIGALLYIGYDSLADDTGDAKALTSVPLDTTDQVFAGQNDDPENLLPDTTGSPVMADLTEDPAPEDKSMAEPDEPEPVSEKKATKADESDKKPAPEERPAKPKGPSATYTVGDGETFFGVANRMNMKVSTLKEMNPGVSENQIKSGITKLNVRVKAIHTVGAGDVLRVVAAKYGVTKEAIMKANHKSQDKAVRGEKLIIPLADKQ